jgi:hypothetical protein
MRKLTLLAAALLLVSTASGYAAPKGAGNTGGASEFSPGDQMRETGGPNKGSRGASEFSPGDQMKDTKGTTGRGASEFSPGNRMNDTRKKTVTGRFTLSHRLLVPRQTSGPQPF